jgi:ergothioneine biosynthesis protein EgtB
VTNAEYLAFVEAGGYARPELWLDDGFSTVMRERWRAPLYWRRETDGSWREHTLSGERALDPNAPVCHVSFYEADAYARWRGARLPTEEEWEVACGPLGGAGSFLEDGALHPTAARAHGSIRQAFGDAWEWTRSAYAPYPGFTPLSGALGEYNAKFMCNQFVLRGGSCLTPRDHARATYRNFFRPDARWQMTGIRLATNAHAKT